MAGAQTAQAARTAGRPGASAVPAASAAGTAQRSDLRWLRSRGRARGIVAMLGHGIIYMFILAPLINGLGHWWGGQNFQNTAYNSRVLAWLTGGESLHNNHHAFPRSPKFSLRRSELDPSWIAIRVLAALRLLAIVGAPLRARPTR